MALQGSFTIYLGANRGRGQAYPNGAASNLVSYRWDDTGMVTGRCFRSLLGGLIYPQLVPNAVFTLNWEALAGS